MTDAACTAINTAIIRESGRISDEIYTRIVRGSPWIALTPRDVWPDGMGLTQSSMTFERMLPADDNEAWVNVAPSDGATNNCIPATEIIKWGQSLATWSLQKIAKETDEFCIEDLRSAFALAKVLANFTDGLKTVSQWVWENRDRNEYIRLAGHKVTETSNALFDINATTFDATKPPTARLTWGTLKRIRTMLLREGAGEGALGFTGQGSPVFSLMTDETTQDFLLTDDPAVRSDFQFAFEGKGEGSPLINPLFLDGFTHNGYKFMTDLWPARYEIVGSAYVRVQPFLSAQAATSGFKREINPAYIYATYQATPIHVRDVFTQRIPQPISNPGGDFHFDPVNYMGQFRWVMDHPGSKCNPDGTIGRFRAVFASGSEPVHPLYGWVVMHLNCGAQRVTHTSCYS